MKRRAFVSALVILFLSIFGRANVASPPRKSAKYVLGDKNGFAYNVNADTQPELFITLELMFRAALRPEEGAIVEFCLLVDKITEDGASAESYSNDLKYIITIIGDNSFAIGIARLKVSQKGRGRLWEYLTWNNSKADYPLTRRILFGE